MDIKRQSIKEAAFISGVYAGVSILWIIVSDYIVMELAKSAFLSMAKGIGFVLVTAVMLFYLTYKLVFGLYKKQSELSEINRNLKDIIAEELRQNREKDIELIKQTRAAEIGGMIGSIAHHWRQPLNVVAIIIQDMKLRYIDKELTDKQAEEMSEAAMKHIYSMSETIDDFYALYETGEEKAPFSIKKNIDSAVAIVKPMLDSMDVKLYMDMQDETAVGYERAFCRAITNILLLSRDSFASDSVESKRIAIVGKKHGDIYRITIEDNSNIKDMDVLQDDVFSVHRNSSRFGVGLGLFVSKLVIEQNMGGVVKAETSDVGMLFVIELKI